MDTKPKISETFAKKLIAINENSYNDYYLQWDRTKPIYRYSKEEVQNIINSGSVLAQKTLSRNYYDGNGVYKQVIMHYATLLKYIGILIPYPIFSQSLQDKAIAKRVNNATDYIEKMNLPENLTRIAKNVLVDGTYYGIIQTLSKNAFALMDLPFDYCRTRFKDEYNNPILEFNVEYFNTIIDLKARNMALNTYPKIITSHYRRWEKSKTLRPWVLVPNDIGVVFNFYNTRPYFLPIIPSVIQYEQAVENELTREVEEYKKILVQKIPHLNDGTLLFEEVEAQVMHDGAVGMLRKTNPNLAVLTTYGDVEVIQSKTADAAANNALNNMAQNMYSNAGVSGQLFAATGSGTLSDSLDYDTSLMMILGNKFSNFITALINKLYGNSNIRFTYKILPITYHNESKKIEDYLKLASSGYSFLMPALAQGLSQKELVGVKNLENDFLGLLDKLRPLSTSYTQSNKENGRPELEEQEKTEVTQKKERSQDNTGNI